MFRLAQGQVMAPLLPARMHLISSQLQDYILTTRGHILIAECGQFLDCGVWVCGCVGVCMHAGMQVVTMCTWRSEVTS